MFETGDHDGREFSVLKEEEEVDQDRDDCDEGSKAVKKSKSKRSVTNRPCPASKKSTQINIGPIEVDVKEEPTSENEWDTDADDNDKEDHFNHYNCDEDEENANTKLIPRRASQRAVVVKREHYREVETDEDDLEMEIKIKQEEEDEEDKQKPSGRKRGRPPGSKNRTKPKVENEGTLNQTLKRKRRKQRSEEDPSSDEDDSKASTSSGDRRSRSREEDRIRKQLKRSQMTSSEREEHLRKQRERKQARRSQMTEEEKEKERRRERERKALKRQLKTPQQKREESQRETMRRIVQHANMTSEEMAQHKQKRYFQYLAQKAKKSEEELERKRRLMTEKQKARRQSLTGEERQKFLEQLKSSYRKRIERLKQNPTQWEEAQKKWKEYRIKRKEVNKARKGQMRRKRREGEETRVIQRRKTCPGIRLAVPGESEEEKQQRLLQNKKMRIQRCNIRRRLAYQKLLDSGMTMEEIRKQKETSEQRERRLITNRINFAKRSIRKRLSQRGAPTEEIEARIQEFVATYEPHRDFKPYVPRPANHRPINQDDLALIQEGKLPCPITDEKTMEVSSNKLTKNRKNTVFAFPPSSSSTTGWPWPAPELSSTSTYSSFPSTALNMSISNFVSPPIPSPSSSSTISEAPYPTTSPYAHYDQYQSPLPHYQQSCYSQQQFQPQSQQFSLFDDINSFQLKASHNHLVYQDDYSSSASICYDPPKSIINNDGSQSQHENNANSCDLNVNPSFMPPPQPLTQIKRGRGRPRGSKKVCAQDKSQAGPDSAASSRGGRRPGAGRPKKGEIREAKHPSKKEPKETKRIPGMPRGVYEGKDPKVKRDMQCDKCANWYSERYISDHRTMFHNPNFDYATGKCLLCHQNFPSGQKFYKHFLKVHKPPKEADGKERNYVCVSCGERFVSGEGLDRHEYYQHGDGAKKENFVSCPHCQKEFKQRITLNNHIRVVHASLGLDLYGCLRCDQKFGLTKELKQHVGEAHPESYFPCEDCNMLKYTKGSLLMHQNYCSKRPTEKKREGRKKEGKYVGIERFPVNCEVCSKQIALYSITRHYKDTHGIVDEVFGCKKCEKTFKRREWWVAHMETVHSISPEEIKEEIGKYNVKDRSKVVITNWGQKRKYSNKGKGRNGKTGKGRGRPKKRKQEVVSSSEEEDEGVAAQDLEVLDANLQSFNEESVKVEPESDNDQEKVWDEAVTKMEPSSDASDNEYLWG